MEAALSFGQGDSRGARASLLVVIALGWVLAARVLLRFSRRPIGELERQLARAAARLPLPRKYGIPMATWAITAAAARVPGTRCLAWSLALRALLGQMAVSSCLRIGVARKATAELDAHAWVHCHGTDWSWGGASVEAYRVLAPLSG